MTMNGETAGVLVAFAAGLLSFLSPCVLPLIPSYITFLTGLSLEDAQRAGRHALLHSALFVLGFSLIFVALGFTATALGTLLLQHREWISRAGGVIIIVFGLYLLGAFNMGMLARERRLHLADKPVGYLGSVLVGVAFGAGWTPCLGPILGSILAYTASAADYGRGFLLLSAYSLGLAVPFLLAALLLQRFLAVFAKLKRTMLIVSRVSGAVLVIIGILMVTDYFTLLASYMQSLTPRFLFERL
jgi:cytochrome c-type biogenesis protein